MIEHEDSSHFREQTISLLSGQDPMEGTLTLPIINDASAQHSDTPLIKAVALLLPDSGPLDRNQNSLQVQLNISNGIANHMAAQGIASVRYDKRGCGLSKGQFDSAGHSDLVADAQAWLDKVRQIDAVIDVPLYVLGHGEGSLIAPQLCAANPQIQGQILLTPFNENFENIIRRQAENALREIAELDGFRGKLIRFFLRLSGDQIAKQKKLVKRIKKTNRDTLKIRKQVINAKWIREMVSNDASAIHSAVKVPSLIIGGEKDLQCLPTDVNKIVDLLSTPVQHHIFSDLTHILRADSGKPSVQNYLRLTLEDVDSRVLNTITNWLLEQTGHASNVATSST